jgi:hypothetical protein
VSKAPHEIGRHQLELSNWSKPLLVRATAAELNKSLNVNETVTQILLSLGDCDEILSWITASTNLMQADKLSAGLVVPTSRNSC